MKVASETQTVRVAVIGLGLIGDFRVQAVEQVPGMQLVAVCDKREDLLRSLTRKRKHVRTFTDAQALAKDADIDAVIVCTPPAFHEPLGIACIEAGKHVLIEKPLATSVAACEALVNAADRFGVCFATGFNLRYLKAAALAKKLVDEGAIGQLDHIRAFHGYSGTGGIPDNWMRDPVMTGGGSLMDNGIHMIDLCRWFLGDVRHTDGLASNHTLQIPGCEDNGFLLMQNSSGKIASLHSTWTEWRGYGYRIEVYGTRGFVRFGYPPMVLIHGQYTESGKVKIKRHFFPIYQVVERIRGWQWGLVETLKSELAGWLTAILSGSAAPISGLDGLESVRIAQAVDRSALGEMSTPRRPDGITNTSTSTLVDQ